MDDKHLIKFYAHAQPNCYTMMLTFTPFFARYLELKGDAAGASTVE